MTHGNGPQVGELALERAAATFDVLGAESMGQIGYVLAQAMQSVGCTAVPILTQVVVDQYSEAFKDPTKFVGPIYGSVEAQGGYISNFEAFFIFLFASLPILKSCDIAVDLNSTCIH